MRKWISELWPALSKHSQCALDGSGLAFLWRDGYFYPVKSPHLLNLDDILGVDEQKKKIMANTQQFLSGFSANNVLLTGARGMGKSSLVKALLGNHAQDGLRLVQLDRDSFLSLPFILEKLADRPEKFILYGDDLSFSAESDIFTKLKSALDGSVSAMPSNVLIYVTSNRRHLMPEKLKDNLAFHHEAGEIHPSEAVEEQVSLAERFGLWLSFYPCSQELYWQICRHWLSNLGLNDSSIDQAKEEALRWSLNKGARSGRVAFQFAKHYAGQYHIRQKV